MSLTAQATVPEVVAELGITEQPIIYGGHAYTARRLANNEAGHPAWRVTIAHDPHRAVGHVEVYWSDRHDAWLIMASDAAGKPLAVAVATYNPGALDAIHGALFYRDGDRWVRKHDLHGGPHDTPPAT